MGCISTKTIGRCRARVCLAPRRAWISNPSMSILIKSGTRQLEAQKASMVVSNSPENTLAAAHSRLPQARGAPVSGTTIDAFCASSCVVPDLIKIDIEGFEIHALRGARQTLAGQRPIVLVEMHPMNWPEIGVAPRHSEQLLGELNYRLRPLDGQADPLMEYGHVVWEPIEGIYRNHSRP